MEYEQIDVYVVYLSYQFFDAAIQGETQNIDRLLLKVVSYVLAQIYVRFYVCLCQTSYDLLTKIIGIVYQLYISKYMNMYSEMFFQLRLSLRLRLRLDKRPLVKLDHGSKHEQSTQKNRHAKKKKKRDLKDSKLNGIEHKAKSTGSSDCFDIYYIVTLPKVLAKPLISGAPLMRSPYHYVSSQALVIMLISFLKV